MGSRNCFYKKQRKRAAQLSLAPWNPEYVALISGANNKTFHTKDHISPRVKVEFSVLGKCRCIHRLNVIYERKFNIWSCSFNQFLGLQQCPVVEKRTPSMKKTTDGSFYHCYLLACSYLITSQHSLLCILRAQLVVGSEILVFISLCQIISSFSSTKYF